MYETKISTSRWFVFDIFGNIGWISYIVFQILIFVKDKSLYDNNLDILVLMGLSTIPSLAILIGIGELITERFKKLDRILPKVRLYMGFGLISYGSMVAVIISFCLLLLAIVNNNNYLMFYIFMCVGSVLSCVFCMLLFKGYKLIGEEK